MGYSLENYNKKSIILFHAVKLKKAKFGFDEKIMQLQRKVKQTQIFSTIKKLIVAHSSTEEPNYPHLTVPYLRLDFATLENKEVFLEKATAGRRKKINGKSSDIKKVVSQNVKDVFIKHP